MRAKKLFFSMIFFNSNKQLGSMIANGDLDYCMGSCGEEDTRKDMEEQLCQGVC